MSKYPAVVRSYNPQKRTVRFEIVGMTDGDNLLPEAELMYPMGDKFGHTEIEIVEGDTVWIEFLADDMRYPLLVGYRNPQHGNAIDWRRFHHKNIELAADDTLILKGKKLVVQFQTIDNTGKTTNNSPVTNKAPTMLDGGVTTSGGGAVASSGGFNVTGDVVADGISLKEHKHTDSIGGKTTPSEE